MVALASCAMALAVSLLLPDLFLPNPFMLFFLAIVVGVIYGGLGPGLLAIALTIALVNYYLIPPFHSVVFTAFEVIRLLVFATVAFLISWVIETRRRAENVVLQQREWLQVTLGSIGDGVIATDTKAQVMFLNAVARDLTGWEQDEANGKPITTVFNIVNQKNRQIVGNPVMRVLAEGKIVGLANDTVLISRSGSEHMIADSGSPIRDHKGKILGAVLVFRDVTEDYEQAAVIRENEERLRSVISDMPVMLVATDADGKLVAWNAECERVTGYSAEEMIGNPQYLERMYPDPVDRAQLYQTRQQEGPFYRDWELELTRKDGKKRIISWSNASPRFSIPGWATWGIGIDVTRRKRAEQHAAGLQALTAALSEALTPQAIADLIISKGFPLVGASIGSISLLESDGVTPRILNNYTVPVVIREKFMELTRSARTHVTDAIRSGQPVWIENLEEYRAQYPEMVESLQAITHTQAVASVPLLVNGRVIGAMGMSFPQPCRFDSEDRELIQTLATQCAQEMQRALLFEAEQQARLRAERAQQRMAFLAEASTVLGSSLDYETTLKHVTHLAVPDIADWCGVDLIDESGDARLVEVAHVNPEKVILVRALREKYPPSPNSGQGIYNVIRTGLPEYFPELPEAVLMADRDEAQKSILRELGFASIMIVPLTVRGTHIGAMTFVTAESGLHFTPEDFALAQEIAHRSALAVDNARLYAQSRQTAATEERQRLSRDLHDAVSQTLFSANIIAQTAARMWSTKPDSVPEWLEQLQRLNQGALAEMRTLLLELRPEGVRTSALADLLRQLCEAAQARRDLKMSLAVNFEGTLPPETHETFYRIAQEALNNVTKHASATTVHISLDEQNGEVVLLVRDNGTGFDPDAISNGFGLNIMRERANTVGAVLTTTSQPGAGTEVILTWTVPTHTPDE
jgi:PAS domain S-box-containing protein